MDSTNYTPVLPRAAPTQNPRPADRRTRPSRLISAATGQSAHEPGPGRPTPQPRRAAFHVQHKLRKSTLNIIHQFRPGRDDGWRKLQPGRHRRPGAVVASSASTCPSCVIGATLEPPRPGSCAHVFEPSRPRASSCRDLWPPPVCSINRGARMPGVLASLAARRAEVERSVENCTSPTYLAAPCRRRAADGPEQGRHLLSSRSIRSAAISGCTTPRATNRRLHGRASMRFLSRT